MIKEEIHDDLRDTDDGITGRVVYTYTSPTHWSPEGICRVVVHYGWYDRPAVSMSWGSGGVNKGFTTREVADAMSEAFSMASRRLEQLEQTHC